MRSLIVSSLLGSCLLVACGGDSAEKVSFAALSSPDREAMAKGSSGSIEASLLFVVALSTPSTACPTVTVTGTDVSIRGGCTDEDGARWTGSVDANVELSGSITIDADDFGTVDADGTFAIDGEIALLTAGSLSSDTSFTADDKTLKIDAEWTSSNDTTTVKAGSTVELEGEGYADISGQWNSEAETDTLVLEGEDTLRLDFTDVNAAGCAAATVDGAASGYICLNASLTTARAAAAHPLAAFKAATKRLLAARQ